MIEDLNGYDEAMNSFDSYDDFDGHCLRERVASAPHRRNNGIKALASMNSFVGAAERKADLAGKTIEQVLQDLLRAAPEMVERLQAYVYGRDYTPAKDIRSLAMQVAHARNEHIKDVQDEYDSENYDPDNFFFDSKERKAMRKKKKSAKWARREERRDKKHRNKMAKLDKEYADTTAPDETPSEDAQDGEDTQPTKRPALKKPMAKLAATDSEGGSALDLANPDAEEAHAEIIGEEMDEQNYDGEVDNFLPFLAGAITLGTKLLSGGSVDGAEIKGLFKKKTPTPAEKAAAAKLPPEKLGDVLNKGIKEAMTSVEKQKKTDFLKEHSIEIVLVVIALIFIGSKIGKS